MVSITQSIDISKNDLFHNLPQLLLQCIRVAALFCFISVVLLGNMSKIKLVIFDIGGTIIEDNGEVISAFSQALAKNGIEASATELKPLKGSSKRDVIKHFVE